MGTTDNNLQKPVTESIYFVPTEPLDPKMTMEDAWLQLVKKPMEYLPSCTDKELSYLTNEDLRFSPIAI